MASKIRIISGFASPREVAKELGVSKAELRTIEDILNKPAVRKKSPRNASGAFVRRRSPAKKAALVARRSSRSESKTIWQVVKASKKSSRNSRS